MAAAQPEPWYVAQKAPFEAFGILYYPLFLHRADLAGTKLDDADMAWAVTANANLDGTGYTLSQPSVLALAAYHHHMVALSTSTSFLPVAQSLSSQGINPLADIERLVPDVTATPMYPDFPSQVMQMDEATFRFHQVMHYASTYGAEQVAGLLGLDVEVGEGWLPDVASTPKTREDEAHEPPKVLHLILTVEDLRSVVEARLASPTRMHPTEVQSALLVFEAMGEEGEVSFPKVAFHENMMELIRMASMQSSATLALVAGGLAQHPGDLLKATRHIVNARGNGRITVLCKKGRLTILRQKGHLATRQKKGLCRAFERFSVMSIAHNIVDASKKDRRALNYLSIERFAGPRLRKACELVSSGEVVSWAAKTEQLWDAVRQAMALGSEQQAKKVTDAWQALLMHYGERPGVLLRSLSRLTKGGCPYELLEAEALAHADRYSLPTLVRTLTIASEKTPRYRLSQTGYSTHEVVASDEEAFDGSFCELLQKLVFARLREQKTPLAGKHVYLDTAGVSLAGSILMPNDTGNTGTAWPPVGIAYDLPDDKVVRFFTFWDERKRRVDVDLHFVGVRMDGSPVKLGWNSQFKVSGMVTSGDVTTSRNSVEYLDAHVGEAREDGVFLVVQLQHIFSGAKRWGDIDTCYSGALVVSDAAADVKLYDTRNLLFKDDLTGDRTWLTYAVINYAGRYVRIVRGADLPMGDVGFCLGDYLAMLLEAQGATLVEDASSADVQVCVGRSDDPKVVSLFDQGFFL